MASGATHMGRYRFIKCPSGGGRVKGKNSLLYPGEWVYLTLRPEKNIKFFFFYKPPSVCGTVMQLNGSDLVGLLILYCQLRIKSITRYPVTKGDYFESMTTHFIEYRSEGERNFQTKSSTSIKTEGFTCSITPVQWES